MSLKLKVWVPVALGGLIVAAYAYFYLLTSTESQSATSIGVANSVGLAAVVIGLIAAGILFRRASPVR